MKKAQRESFGKVPETCHDIDKGLRALEEIIKDKTSSLRDALTNTIDELLDAEQKISDLEDKLSDANTRIDELEAILHQYEGN